LTTFHPAELQSETVFCADDSKPLKPGQALRVLSWNVQYMAGKNYVFFYDLPDNSGPDERPSTADIEKTLIEVARVIVDESPDVILLQEVDDGAKRTDYADHLDLLMKLLPEDYGCRASTFYWRAKFVPHPRIMGSVGMKLCTISRYKMRKAVRHQLPIMKTDPLTRQFNFKRAVLEVRLPVEGAKDLVVLNTHLDAFAQGSDTMERQVDKVRSIVSELADEGVPWLIGGDFNLLPPGKARSLLSERQKKHYREKSEIKPLFDKYQAVPDLEEINGAQRDRWFTHLPNDPAIKKPNKTIDYIFYSKTLRLGEHYVRQRDTLEISDHLPVVAEFLLPE
jgi:endonuclease/exonuclease/phosphatase family metal-dependent hydrolase